MSGDNRFEQAFYNFATRGFRVATGFRVLISLVCAVGVYAPVSAEDPAVEDQGPSLQMDHDIVSAIIFLATFDDVADLNLSCDEGWVSAAKSIRDVVQRKEIAPEVGFSTSIVEGGGRLGDAIQFHRTSSHVLFYKADEFHNGRPAVVPDWSATLSVWVRSAEIGAPGKRSVSSEIPGERCATVLQLTQPGASGPTLSVELESTSVKEAGGSESELRLMASTHSRDPALTTEADQTLVRVKRAPLSDGKWHHLCLTVDRVNLPDQDAATPSGGVVAMFLDGRRLGRSTMNFPMTLDHSRAALVLGYRFDGSLDSLWIADRVLSDREIRRVYERPELFR